MGNKKHNKAAIIIFSTVVVLINAFIIVTASLSNEASQSLSNFFARIAKTLFNISGEDTTEIVDVTDLDLEYDTLHQYNSINGYNSYEIAIGTSKRLVASVAPDNASNTAVKYEVSDSHIASIRQEGNYLYVTGLTEGNVSITATSLANQEKIDTYSFNIVNKRAPINYEVSDISVYQGSLFYLPINVTEEYPDYYNLDLLSLTNGDPSIVDKSTEYSGLYYASSIGEATFTVNSSKSFKVTVNSNSGVSYPVMNSITGKESINEGASTQYSVEFSNEPSSKGVLWSVSKPAYASISKDGYFTAKTVTDETNVIVIARSLLNPSIFISKTIIILPRTVTDFTLSASTYGDITNKSIETDTGQQIKITIDNTLIKRQGITVTSSDSNIAKAYEQGNSVLVECLIEGNVRITITSNENPNISKYIDISVVPRGVINHDNFAQFAFYVRKSLGHFLLFLLDGIFMLLLFNRLDDVIEYKHKKCWHYLVVVLVFAIFMAFLSEFIQFFIPYRNFALRDVGIDLLGYIVGAGITYLIIYLVKKHRLKKYKPNDKM